MTPAQHHGGQAEAILEYREQVYREAKNCNPQRWSRDVRNWNLEGQVWLNWSGFDQGNYSKPREVTRQLSWQTPPRTLGTQPSPLGRRGCSTLGGVSCEFSLLRPMRSRVSKRSSPARTDAYAAAPAAFVFRTLLFFLSFCENPQAPLFRTL